MPSADEIITRAARPATSPLEPAAVELRNASARYASGRASRQETPLAGVDLAVRPGELVAVLGPNGAGKSTLLRVLSGQLAPFDGEARLFGTPMHALELRDIARTLAVVAQTESVAFGFTVAEVVAMGRAPHQALWRGALMRESDRDHEVVREAMARCDLTALADRPASELSGGERQRVAIARALAQEPKVLLLDEPAAFLDVRHQIELFALLADEVTRASIACVVVMHDLNVAAQYATRVALLSRGRMVASGKVEEVMTYARLREVFEADLYVGVNELTGDRFFLPMRAR